MSGSRGSQIQRLPWWTWLALAALTFGIAVRVLPTSAQADTAVHLTAAGDYGNSAQAAATLTKLGSLAPDAHLTLGDLSYTDDPEQVWCDFVTSRVGAGFPFELLAGNHESNGADGDINDFSACLPNQIPGVVGTYGREYYYDLPRANPLVRVVNASAGLVFPEGTWNYTRGDAHFQWTAAAIDGARSAGIPWVVVNTHYPCLSISVYTCVMPADFFSLMQEKKVDLVLTGHDHAYMRTHQLRSGTTACPRLVPEQYDDDCVADSDNVYAAGAGSVFAIVGTGGVPLRTIDTGDVEAPYFAAASGSNQNPTWGVLDLQATPTELVAQFVRSAGGSFSDGFRITRAGATNSPPVARFTAAPAGLDVTVDGGTSSDPDGSIVSYAWDFGDGGSATGQTAQHQYSAGNTYQVSLTVTDDRGATATTSQAVTVTPPSGGAPPPPTGVTAQALTQTSTSVSWNQAPGATSYTVLRDGQVAGTATTRSFTDTGLTPATTYRYTVTASNDQGTSLPSSQVTVTTKTYVVSGDVWRFSDTGADLGTGWRAPTFNDGGWRSGPTQLGYGDGDEATTLSWGSNPSAKPITNYARINFDAGSNIASVSGLAMRVRVDDAAVVYLNGQEVWRFNLPAGTITASTRASRYIAGTEEQLWRTVSLPRTALRTGSNTVAVEVHNDLPASSDMSWDLELRPS